MKCILRGALATIALLSISAMALYSAEAKPTTATCVGLYSETDGGFISYQLAGKTDWVVVKLGDVLPLTATIRIKVDRDWLELRPTNNPNVAFELEGSESGDVVKKVSDVLGGKPRTVAFPKGTAAKPDPKYKDKLVVTKYLGRQIYKNADGDSKDIKYGDVLDIKGKVRIIAINNTIDLMNASGGVSTVIGPLNFTIEQVLSNKALYKFLNVQN